MGKCLSNKKRSRWPSENYSHPQIKIFGLKDALKFELDFRIRVKNFLNLEQTPRKNLIIGFNPYLKEYIIKKRLL